jgi:hypothetical protein
MLRKRNGHIYCYVNFREDGKVRTLYAGSGEIALDIDLEQQIERQERSKKRHRAAAKRRRAQGRLDDLETMVINFSAAVDAVVQAAGYHRWRRHQWRRRRAMKTTPRQADAWNAQPEEQREAKQAETVALMDRCKAGGLSDKELARFRSLLVESGLAEQMGAFGEALKTDLARQYNPSQLGTSIFYAWFDGMFADIAGPNPTPLERLLSFRIVCTWTVANLFERQALDSADSGLNRRADRAHRRFLSSVKTLSDIRRLPSPTLNILVNVENPAAAVGARLRPPPAIEAEATTGD